MLKVVSLCFEVCDPQRNALTVNKSKAKTGKNRHVSQDIRHLHEVPWGKGLWDTIRSSKPLPMLFKSRSYRLVIAKVTPEAAWELCQLAILARDFMTRNVFRQWHSGSDTKPPISIFVRLLRIAALGDLGQEILLKCKTFRHF